MARAGLGALWKCVFADDINSKKAASYAANWGSDELRVEDIGKLAPAGLPGVAMLAWASFPCQDLSLAGAGAGLRRRALRHVLAILEINDGLGG